MNYLIFMDQTHLDDVIRNYLDEDRFLEFVQVDNFIFKVDRWYIEGQPEQMRYRSFKVLCRKLLNLEKENVVGLKAHLGYDRLYELIEKYRLLIE